jgi:cytochrome P450
MAGMAHPPSSTHPEPTADPTLAFDPMDMERTKDWDLLRRIRNECPVMRPTAGVVFTARHGDTAKVFKDAKGFSSAGDMRAPGVTVSEEESFLGELDPPLHPKIRRILLRGFTLQAANDDEDWTRGNVRRRLDAIKAAGGADLMAGLAIALPGSIAAHALGIPDEMHDQVMDWCNEVLHSTWPYTGATDQGTGIAACFPELAAQIDAWIAEREAASDAGAASEADAPPGLLTVMVKATDESGWRIHHDHIRTLTINILAGSLSASYMIGNLLYRFLTDEGFAGALRSDPKTIPAAVEETLRMEAPVTFLMRTIKRDTEIGGCPVFAGEHVMLGIASSGRDDTVYPDAEEFRLDRVDPPEHLAFGFGPHLCLGNHLTRMVGKVVLEEFIDTFPPGTVALAPDFAWECVAHVQEYGPEHLEVVARSAADDR